MSGDGDQGIRAYDLTPPLPPMLKPSWVPLNQHPRLPSYVPPPLADGMARVELGDDYYAGPCWSDWQREDTPYPGQVFDIPAAQRERWRKAQKDYARMQEEIDALVSARAVSHTHPPDGWTPATPAG